MRAARIRTAATIAAVVIALVMLLFDVRYVPRWQLPGELQLPDPEQEARYSNCFAEQDHRIHEVAFGTIDNPDVQREYIATERDKARSDCRQKFPRRLITETRPFDFNLIDLDFRFD